MLEVLASGMLTSVQDLGRPALEHEGISPSGAADPVSLKLGNRLVGNPEGAAALEATLVGPQIRFDAKTVFAITGGQFEASLDGVPIPGWRSLVATPGQVLKINQARSGCRAYLCVQGGINVDLVFGSASTHLQSGLGGLEGRALRKGDRLALGRSNGKNPELLISEKRVGELIGRANTIRVTAGIHERLFTEDSVRTVYEQEFLVSEQSNRLGLRLRASKALSDVPQVASVGVCNGTVQVASDGSPMIVFVEQQLTGGYPQIASIISADLAAIGQLKPRERIRFKQVSLKEAHEAWEQLERVVSGTEIFE